MLNVESLRLKSLQLKDKMSAERRLEKEIKKVMQPINKGLKTIPVVGEAVVAAEKNVRRGKLFPQQMVRKLIDRGRNNNNNNYGGKRGGNYLKKPGPNSSYNEGVSQMSSFSSNFEIGSRYNSMYYNNKHAARAKKMMLDMTEMHGKPTIIRGRDVLLQPNTNTLASGIQGSNLWAGAVNPTTLVPSSRMVKFANLYQFYNFLSVTLEFIPALGFTATNNILCGYNGNPLDRLSPETFNGYIELSEREGSAAYSIGKSFKWKVPLISSQNAFVCQPGYANNQADLLYDQGQINLKWFSDSVTNNGATFNGAVGVFMIDYEIAFFEAEIESKDDLKVVQEAVTYRVGSVIGGVYPITLVSMSPAIVWPGVYVFWLTYDLVVGSITIPAYQTTYFQSASTSGAGNLYSNYSNLVANVPIYSTTTFSDVVKGPGGFWVNIQNGVIMQKDQKSRSDSRPKIRPNTFNNINNNNNESQDEEVEELSREARIRKMNSDFLWKMLGTKANLEAGDDSYESN